MKVGSLVCYLLFSISLVYIQTLEKREYYQWVFDMQRGTRERRKWTLDERLILVPKLLAEFSNELLKLLLINRQIYLDLFVAHKLTPLSNVASLTDFFVTGSKVENTKNELLNVMFFNDVVLEEDVQDSE